MKTKVLICENCKRIYISDLYGKLNFHCYCSHKILSETHESNRIHAENYFKKYFQFPLTIDEYSDMVFDKNYARAFDFELSFNGDPVLSITRKSKEKLIKCLNDDDFKPKNDLNLKYVINKTTILMDNKNFITIRNWGRLTSTNYSAGCFGLSVEQAKNIQDQFAEFIISKISTEYKIIETL